MFFAFFDDLKTIRLAPSPHNKLALDECGPGQGWDLFSQACWRGEREILLKSQLAILSGAFLDPVVFRGSKIRGQISGYLSGPSPNWQTGKVSQSKNEIVKIPYLYFSV